MSNIKTVGGLDMKKKQSDFQKSSFSGHYGCVGVILKNDIIMVANTKSKDKVVKFSSYEWECFLRGVKAGEFDHFGELNNG